MATSRSDSAGPSAGPAFLWREHENGLLYAQFEPLERAGVPHAVFGRRGGLSQPPFDSLNTGRTVGDDPEAVAANVERICRVLGVRPEGMVTAHLVHGRRVAVVGRDDAGRIIPRTDALLTACPEVTLFLRFADCVPLLIYDPHKKVAAVIHAGWKGTVAQISLKTVATLISEYHCQPHQLQVGIDSSVVRCIERELPHAHHYLCTTSDGSVSFDLWQANRQQLREGGIKEAHIHCAGLCTSCNVHLFFSHRKEHGHTGRFGALIGLTRH